ncbi:hypothetical protein ACWEV4_30530 [Streptomyces sp. NPDC003860]
MSVLGGVLLVVIIAGVAAVAWLLTEKLPSVRWFNRAARMCPNCGFWRVRTVVSDNRLNGMLECRSCNRVWNPAEHRR